MLFMRHEAGLLGEGSSCFKLTVFLASDVPSQVLIVSSDCKLHNNVIRASLVHALGPTTDGAL